MREIKFRIWDNGKSEWLGASDSNVVTYYGFHLVGGVMTLQAPPVLALDGRCVVEQYTGLKDKNGKEIYENCELDGRYRVEYIAPKFVGKDMIKGDIIELYDNKFTITKEHCEISQNPERDIN